MKFAVLVHGEEVGFSVDVTGEEFVLPGRHAIDVVRKRSGKWPTTLTLTKDEIERIEKGPQLANIVKYTLPDPAPLDPLGVLLRLFAVQTVEVRG